MNGFWAGVLTGIGCALMLNAVMFCIYDANTQELNAKFTELEQRQQKIEDWEKDNETVMQTYKFFNQSWQAIIDMERH